MIHGAAYTIGIGDKLTHTKAMKWRIVLCMVLVSVACPAMGFAVDAETARLSKVLWLIVSLM